MNILKTYKGIPVGTKLIVVSSNNGQNLKKGDIVETTTTAINDSSSIQAKIFSSLTNNSKSTMSFFINGPGDELSFLDKKQLIELLTKEVNTLKKNRTKSIKDFTNQINKEIKDSVERLEYHTKYETEEDFVADKLEQILSASENNKTKESRVSAIKDVLSTLKSSNLL